MNKMTSKERMIAAIKNEPVDHLPLGQLFHSTILETPADRQWKNQFERTKIMVELGLDPVVDIWLPAPAAPADIKVRHWKEDNPDGPLSVFCAEYETPAGKLTQKVRETNDWYHHTHYRFLPEWDGNAHRRKDQFEELEMMDDFFTRRFIVPLVRGAEDLDAFECLLKAPAGKERDEWIANAKEAKKLADEMGVLTHARRVSIGDWFMWVCLIEDFCMAMASEPDYVNRFYSIVQNYNKEIIDMVLEAEPDVIQYRGWYDTPDYWGNQRHKEILVPRINELARQSHDGGALFCYLLTEGYTHYKDALKDMEMDVLLGLEPYAARKSEDLKAVKEALSNKTCIWGGVNAPITVGMGTDEDIDNAVKYAIETLGPDGFILNASMYFYDDDVTWDRFMVFVNTWKKYANI